MIEVTENDLQLLTQFPLKWRWTDPKFQLLPPDALTTIKPLSESIAKAIWEIFRPFAYDDSLAPELFDPIIQFNVRSESQMDTRAWLESFGIDRELRVIVSWQPELGISVPFGIFCDDWDDFCYPGSDDVIVSPYSQEWSILYHHEEVCFFGLRRAFQAKS